MNICFREKYINMSGVDILKSVLYSAALFGVAAACFEFNKSAFFAACRLSDYILYGEEIEEKRIRRKIKKEEVAFERHGEKIEKEEAEFERLREKFEKEEED